MTLKSKALWILLFALLAGSCYTFKASSVDPSIHSFTIKPFTESAAEVSPGYGVTLSEALRNRILRETRLVSVPDDGDIVFEGQITDYSITPISPQSGETTAREELRVKVLVKYEDRQNPAKSWEESFMARDNYDANQNFSDVEDQLLESITTQIVDAVFRKAFENW